MFFLCVEVNVRDQKQASLQLSNEKENVWRIPSKYEEGNVD